MAAVKSCCVWLLHEQGESKKKFDFPNQQNSEKVHLIMKSMNTLAAQHETHL